MGNLKSVPKLRFPEFQEPWYSSEITEVLKIGSGKDYKHLDIGEIPVFGTGGLMTKVNEYLYDGETVCIGRKGTIDKPMFYSGKIWTVDTLFYTYAFKKIEPIFVYYLFLNINWKQYNEASGVPSLSKSTIEKIVINYPLSTINSNEQNKIATFLSAVDEKLQALKKKKSLLEEYKKGVMQQLFRQPEPSTEAYENEEDQAAIKSQPSKKSKKSPFRQLRFKREDGGDFPDWEVKKLGEVLDIQGGFAFKSSNFNQGNTKVIRIGDISPNIYLNSFTGVYSNENPGNKYLVRKNDFLMALSGATFGKVGKIKDENIGYINQRVAAFKTKFCLEFFFQLVQTEAFKDYINSIPSASAQPNISNNDILKYDSYLPSHLEQTKIANFLSALDEKINGVQVQIEKMEIWKKGLLQSMFV